MKLKELYEKSSVIEKGALTLLQTALHNEDYGNLEVGGSMACLLMAVCDVIKQQTGVSIDRLNLFKKLDQSINDNQPTETFYNQKKYHDFGELVKAISKDGVKLYKSKDKKVFDLKLHSYDSINDIINSLKSGISILLCLQIAVNGSKTDTGAFTLLNAIEDVFDNCDIEDNKSSLTSFKTFRNSILYTEVKNELTLSFGDKLSDQDVYKIAQGILPYKKYDNDGQGFHSVSLVGYDSSQKVFIIKDIREKYLANGFAKIDEQYLKDCIDKKSGSFIKAAVGIEI